MAAEAAHLQDHVQPKHFLLSLKKKIYIYFFGSLLSLWTTFINNAVQAVSTIYH